MHFHHLGVACADIEMETVTYRALGYAPEGEDFVDPLQGIQGRFLLGGARGSNCWSHSRAATC